MTMTDKDLDGVLHVRFGDAMGDLARVDQTKRAEVHPHEPTRKRFTRSPRRLQAGAALLGVLALGVVPAYAAGRASATAPKVSTSKPQVTATATVASPLVVQQAINWALSSARSDVLSVSRIEVKLVTYKDFSRVWGDLPGTCSQGSDAYIVNGTEYVVAMSGDFVTPSTLPKPVALGSTPSPTPRPASTMTTTHWAALFMPTDPDGIPEAAPRFFVANVNMPGNWPPCFDMLTNVAH